MADVGLAEADDAPAVRGVGVTSGVLGGETLLRNRMSNCSRRSVALSESFAERYAQAYEARIWDRWRGEFGLD